MKTTEEQKLVRRNRMRLKRAAEMARLEAKGIILVADDTEDDIPRRGIWCKEGKLVINRCSTHW